MNKYGIINGADSTGLTPSEDEVLCFADRQDEHTGRQFLNSYPVPPSDARFVARLVPAARIEKQLNMEEIDRKFRLPPHRKDRIRYIVFDGLEILTGSCYYLFWKPKGD